MTYYATGFCNVEDDDTRGTTTSVEVVVGNECEYANFSVVFWTENGVEKIEVVGGRREPYDEEDRQAIVAAAVAELQRMF